MSFQGRLTVIYYSFISLMSLIYFTRVKLHW